MACNGDSTNSGSGLVFRTAKLYNNERFSDIEFLVKEQSGYKTFKAHRLIFAMASEKFASLLYSNDPTKASNKIQISDFSPQIFQIILQYLYTDELNLTNINEAIDVFKLSSKYGIKELVEKCRNYVGQDKITGDNILFMYDIALKENMRDLLFRCRDIVCTNTKSIFSSMQFRETPIGVLIDILNQESLAVEKEIEVINAVLLWCKRDCERRGRPLEAVCIRDSMSPLLPYLRFLTLSGEEFCDFVEENCIFSSPETALLTRKILEPKGDCRVPSGFCSISRQRGPVTDNSVRSDTVRATHAKPNGNVPEQRMSLKGTAVTDSSVRSDTVRATHAKPNGNVPEQRMSLKGTGRQQSYDEPPSWLTKPPLLATVLSSPLDSQFSLPTYSFPQNGVKDESLPVQSKPQVPLFQYPVASTKKSPLLKVLPPTTFNRQKIYEIPLQEMPKAMSSMSMRDLICSAEITVSRGNMVIFGVDLKVLSLPLDPNESITVGLCVTGDFPEINSIYSEKLSNDMIRVPFSEPLKLTGNNSAKIQIFIENLKLHRCYVCKVPTCELNSGLNLNAEVTLKSNQNNETEGFFFLISRIIYS